MQAPENAEWDVCLTFDEPCCWVPRLPCTVLPAGYVSWNPCCSFTNCKTGSKHYSLINWTGLD